MTIAVAHTDTSEGAAALVAAADEARRHGADLAVLRALPGPEAELDSGAEAELRRRIAEVVGTDLTWQLHVVADAGSPPRALLDLASEVGAARLVIGTRRRSPVGKLLMGSTVQRIILESPIPVLVVKAHH